jgi:hypothetical protein
MLDEFGSTHERERGADRPSAQDRRIGLIPLATCLAVAAVVLVIELL